MTLCNFYLLKFDATEHNGIEKFMHKIGLSQYAFLVPVKESSLKFVLGMIKGNADNEHIIRKFHEIETKVYDCELEEYLEAYALIGKEYTYNQSPVSIDMKTCNDKPLS